MDNKKEIDIPFEAFDSELYYQEINIPDGFEATIEDNKIILKRKESEDERIRKELIDIVAKSPITFAFEDKNKVLAWLEKQGEQKSALSEEDKQRLRELSIVINKATEVQNWWKEFRLISKEEGDNLLNWLKSLRPQNTWKPSDEQMEAVKEAACYSSVFSEKTIDNLISLSKQLKKLREE